MCAKIIKLQRKIFLVNFFVIGNGESRRDFDLNKLNKFTTYGCNAIFRDYTVDVLVCKDLNITEELYQSDYLMTNTAYTFPEVRTFILNKYQDEVSKKNMNLLPIPNINTHIHYYAGLQALTMAVKQKPDNIFILGFDMTNRDDNKFNTVYKDTNAYKTKEDEGPAYVKERKQFISLIDKNRDHTNYFYVLPKEYQIKHSGPLTESILTNKQNYSVITYNQLGAHI